MFEAANINMLVVSVSFTFSR